MKIFRIAIITVLATFAFDSKTFAQDEQPPPEQRAPITTDRPSFTTDSNMISPGEYQLELGYTYVDGDSTFPETLLRYGFNKNWEIRIGWDGYTVGDQGSDVMHGMSLGFKRKLKALKWMDDLDNFSLVLISIYTLPTGNVPDDIETLNFIGWNYQINETTSLAGNVGFGSPEDIKTRGRFIQGLSSILISRTMGNSTSIFGEFYTNVPAAEGEDAEYVIQSGLLHRLNNDTQIDFRIGIGLNEQASDWLFGLGFSRRF